MPKGKNNNDLPSRGMPSNPEAEVGVLGSILIDSTAADTIIPLLEERDFFVQRHAKIFHAICILHNSDKPIDTVTVADELELEKELEDVGSISYLSELAESVLTSANGEYYAGLIKRDSLLRKVINAGTDMTKFAYECTDGAEALEKAERLVYEIAEQNTEKSLVKLDTALANVINSIEEAQMGNRTDGAIRTFFPAFDRATKGLKPGELILLAARPSVGKTAFALNIAANVALSGKKVAIFSLEMSSELLVKRMLAYVSGITFNEMERRGGLTGERSDMLMRAYRRLLATDVYIDDYSINSPADILSKCRRLKREKGLDLIIVDYLQLMQGNSSSSRGFESRQVEVSDMTRKMKIYSKELQCPILLLSQMSRAIDDRKSEPMLSDLRESGAIEQDADIVAFLHRPSTYNRALPDNEIKLLIKKNRNGALAEIDLDFNGETTSFREVENRGEDAPAKSEPQPKTQSYQDASANRPRVKDEEAEKPKASPADEVTSEPLEAQNSASELSGVRFMPQDSVAEERAEDGEDKGPTAVSDIMEGMLDVEERDPVFEDEDVFDNEDAPQEESDDNSAPSDDDAPPFDPDDGTLGF